MEILFVAGFAPIVADPPAGIAFYRDTLDLPLEVVSGDYVAVDGFGGTKHLGVWPLADAVQSCYGTDEWPDDVAVPADELVEAGHQLVHHARTEPWGQTVARLLGPEGLLIGLCQTPWLH